MTGDDDGRSDQREHPHHGQPQRDVGGPGRHGLGMSRGHGRGPADDIFASRADRSGAEAWARQHDWVPVEGSDPRFRDAQELVRSAPARRGASTATTARTASEPAPSTVAGRWRSRSASPRPLAGSRSGR